MHSSCPDSKPIQRHRYCWRSQPQGRLPSPSKENSTKDRCLLQQGINGVDLQWIKKMLIHNLEVVQHFTHLLLHHHRRNLLLHHHIRNLRVNEKVAGNLLQQVLGEGTGYHLQQLPCQKLVIFQRCKVQPYKKHCASISPEGNSGNMTKLTGTEKWERPSPAPEPTKLESSKRAKEKVAK